MAQQKVPEMRHQLRALEKQVAALTARLEKLAPTVNPAREAA